MGRLVLRAGRKMKFRKIYPGVIIIALLLTSFNQTGKLPDRTQHMLETRLEGGLISAAEYANTDQFLPAAAYSSASDQYLVVYEHLSDNTDILGQLVDAENGDLIGSWFNIANSSQDEYSPAVVYDPYQNRFLVVWSERYCQGGACNFVIKGRLVYGSEQNGNNLAGPEFTIANEHKPDGSGYDLISPAVACNEKDHQFIVVYLRGMDNLFSYKSVYGQMLKSHENTPQVLSGSFNGFKIITLQHQANTAAPSVAWSSHGKSFLVVWEEFSGKFVDEIAARYVYDTFQGAENEQLMGPTAWNLAPKLNLGDDPLVDDYNSPSVAYDPQNQNYVVVFTHFQDLGANSTRKVYAQRLEKAYINGNKNIGFEIEIATMIDANYIAYYDPQIVYSGIRDEMYVVYLMEYTDTGEVYFIINERTLRGKFANPSMEVRRSAANGYLDNPAAAGTDDGRALVIWNEQYAKDPYDYDVYAQRIKAFSLVYLPNVVR
jgi:hypothetical protein